MENLSRCHSDLPSLCCRWADNFKAEGCGGSKEHSFQHPFLQVPAYPPAHLQASSRHPWGWFLSWSRDEAPLVPQKPSNSLLSQNRARVQEYPRKGDSSPWEVCMILMSGHVLTMSHLDTWKALAPVIKVFGTSL